MKNFFDRIDSVKLLGGLSEEQITEMLDSAKCSIKDYSRGQIIHIEREECQAIDLILEGRVSVQKIDEDGNTMIISSFNTGEALGANLVFSKRNQYPFHIVAASQTTILHLGKRTILELCKNNQAFMINLLEFVSDRSLTLTDKINNIVLKTLRQKILDYLELESLRQSSDIIRLPVTKKELAESLGVQRTSLSRELNKMKKESLIDFNSKEIIILSKEKKRI